MEAVVEGGFGALSMNKLADAVDFTPGALYRYFDSKDALLSALVHRVLDDVHARLVASVLSVPESEPLERVLALTGAYGAFSREEPHKFGLLAMAMAEPQVLLTTPESAAPVVQAMIATLAPLADALARAETTGGLAPGDSLERTLVCFTAVQGALQLRKQARIAPQLIDVDRLSAHAVRTLLVGWGADAGALETMVAPARTGRRGGSS
jgi:AcrR family transcriptional regulator